METLARCYHTKVDKIPKLPGPHVKWRLEVLKRDGFKCQECGLIGTRTNLQVHHIVPVRDPNCILFDVENGITLCQPCHKKTFYKEYDFKDKYLLITASRRT